VEMSRGTGEQRSGRRPRTGGERPEQAAGRGHVDS
jgi:hypothetical protein